MVLWLQILFAVIFVVSFLTCAKTENELHRISLSSIDQIQSGFQRYCAQVPVCRYNKILTAIRDSYDINAETPNYNLKVKKNLPADRTEVLGGSNSLEGGTPSEDNGLLFDDLDGNDISSNSYEDLEFFKPGEMKRANSLPSTACDCKVKNELLDLGHLYYPRYLFNAVCHKDDRTFDYPPKCLPGAQCRPLEYKVRVLTHRSHNDHMHKDPTASLLPEVLRSVWKFKTVTIAAGCFCS